MCDFLLGNDGRIILKYDMAVTYYSRSHYGGWSFSTVTKSEFFKGKTNGSNTGTTDLTFFFCRGDLTKVAYVNLRH